MRDDEAGRARESYWLRLASERRLAYYRVLGLEPGASVDELKLAHRDLVKVWHPDRFADDPRLQMKAQEKLKQINEAYEFLLGETTATLVQSALGWPAAARRPIDFWRDTFPADWMPPLRPIRQGYRSARAWVGLGLLAIVGVVVLDLVFSSDAHMHDTTASSLRGQATEASSNETSSSIPAGTTFGLGSSPDRVLAVQGTPTSVEGSRWMYDLSSVEFLQDKLEDYSNISRNLRVRLYPRGDVTEARNRGYFALGSTQDEVLALQGTPISVEGNRWRYNSSSLDFWEGKVVGYSDVSHNLRVRLNPTADPAAARRRGYFTLGSNPDEVLVLQGTPNGIEGSRWRYDSSTVDFARGGVEGYSNVSRNLRVELYPRGNTPEASSRGYFNLGSSQNEVLAIQGTPTGVAGQRWAYELSWIRFVDGKVESYSNFSGNLKLRVHE